MLARVCPRIISMLGENLQTFPGSIDGNRTKYLAKVVIDGKRSRLSVTVLYPRRYCAIGADKLQRSEVRYTRHLFKIGGEGRHQIFRASSAAKPM